MSASPSDRRTFDELVRQIERGDLSGDAAARAERLVRESSGDLRAFSKLMASVATRVNAGISSVERGRLATRAAEILVADFEEEDQAKRVLFDTARQLLQLGDGEEPGFELLHRIFELDPNYPPMLRAVADYHRADGEPGEAARFYLRYLDAAPGAPDASLVQLRMAQIAMGYEEEEVASRYLGEAVAGALPELEVPIARILSGRLIERHPHDDGLREMAQTLEQMETDPRSLERALHRHAVRASAAERAVLSRRLGRLREIRLSDAEGAAIAYQDALHAAPGDVVAMSGVERLLGAQPGLVLELARAALADVGDDAAAQRQLHTVAARAAARHGDAEGETEHYYYAFLAAPHEASGRRLAARKLRRTDRNEELLEVLRAEASWGNRLAALVEGAEIIGERLGQLDAALSWANEALQLASESGRTDELERAQALMRKLSGEPEPKPKTAARRSDERAEAAPEPEAAAEPQTGAELDTGAAAQTTPQPEDTAVTIARPAHEDTSPSSEDRPAAEERPAADTERAVGQDEAPATRVPGRGVSASDWDVDAGWGEGEDDEELGFGVDDRSRLAAEAALVRGRVQEAQGQIERAIESYEQALEAMPRRVEALSRLAEIHENAGNREEALSCLDRLLFIVEEGRERTTIILRRAMLTSDAEQAAKDVREAIEAAAEDREMLDLCTAAATARQLWDLRALARERRRRLGDPPKPSLLRR